MVLEKAKGGSHLANGETRRSTGIKNHWAFLDEIEAPMWADLTLEAQFMDQDIDDAWFRILHPIHQMPSRLLKSCFPYSIEQNLKSPKLSCPSPVLPDSVSRSRGKHYRIRKWVGNDHLSMDGVHPIRKLGGKIIAGQHASSSTNSASTVITNSSLRKPSSTMDISSVSSVESKLSLRGKRSTSIAKDTSLRGSSNTKYPFKGENEGKSFLQDRRSTSSNKSSVGSSYSLSCKLDGIDSASTLQEERRMESKKDSGPMLDRNSSSKHQKKAADAKLTCRESKSKVVGSTLSRKPLDPLNESGLVKAKNVMLATQSRQSVATGKLSSLAVSKKKIVGERKIQNPKAWKPSGKGLSDSKGKSNEGSKRETNLRSVVPRTYFR